MPAILADHNIEGYFALVLRHLESGKWLEVWSSLHYEVVRFADLGVPPEVPDRELWLLCQARSIVLLTANRNSDGADSLGSTIQQLSSPGSLPVITLADPRRILRDRAYVELVAERLLALLLDLDALRGTGRLYLP